MIKSFSALSGDRRLLLSVTMSPTVLIEDSLAGYACWQHQQILPGESRQDWVTVPVGKPVVRWGVSNSKFYSYDVAPLRTAVFNVMKSTQCTDLSAT